VVGVLEGQAASHRRTSARSHAVRSKVRRYHPYRVPWEQVGKGGRIKYPRRWQTNLVRVKLLLQRHEAGGRVAAYLQYSFETGRRNTAA